MRATRALVHLDILKANISAIKKRVGENTRLCLPIKADAYGHGAVRVAVAGIRAGVSYLAVASIQEGAELRSSGIVAPILLLSLPIPEELNDIVASSLTPLVADIDFARQLSQAAGKQGERVGVHLKIDTGMGRIGCRPEASLELARSVAALPALTIEGCSTHLAVADSLEPSDLAYTEGQLDRFDEAVAAIREAGIDPGIIHAANSGAVVLHPRASYDMVRPGLLVYGYQPVPSRSQLVQTRPVMELETKIVFIKKLREGETVSYGRSWTAPSDTLIATLPIGYADGLPRSLSGRHQVLIRDRLYPLVGRICMDQCMVNLGPQSELERWERVVIFGPDPRGASADDVAQALGTIPYEISCGVNRRVPRVYIE